MYEWLEAIRIFLSFSFLVASSCYDLKTREVSNSVWILFAPSGFLLLLLQFLFTREGSFLVLWMLSFVVTSAISLVLFYLGFFGGADAKALICLSIALPGYPSLVTSILRGSFLLPIFPLAVLMNAVLGSSLMVLVIMAYNLFMIFQNKGRLFEGLEEEPLWKKILTFIIGFKVDPNRLKKGSHYLPLEYFSKSADGKVVRHLRVFLHLQEETLLTEEYVKTFSKDFNGKIWATPGLPFLVFLTGGFVAALLMGDFVSWLTFQLISAKGV